MVGWSGRPHGDMWHHRSSTKVVHAKVLRWREAAKSREAAYLRQRRPIWCRSSGSTTCCRDGEQLQTSEGGFDGALRAVCQRDVRSLPVPVPSLKMKESQLTRLLRVYAHKPAGAIFTPMITQTRFATRLCLDVSPKRFVGRL